MRNAQSGEEFHAAISQAKQTNPHGAYVTAYDAADYGGMKTFLSDNGKTGIAVKPDGDIVSVFNAPDSGHKGATNTLLPLAIENGGNKLDNYDGKLSLLYQKFGFIPVAKVKFDPQYAPDDWNYERDGQPDIIFWVHNGDSADVVAENIGQYPIHDLSQVPYFDSYDEAAAYRDSLIGQQNQAGPNGPASFMPENNSRSFSVDSESGGSIEITAEDVKAVQSIGRKSVNDFTSEDIAKTEGFARKYFQEMGVKSPFFRAWFGDWRAGDTTPIHIVTEPDSTRGVKVNIDTGWNIQVSGKVFNETKAHNSQQNVKARPYLGYINSLVENAVLLDSYTIPESKAKSANSTMMHSFYAIADMGNGRELIKLYVEELNDVNSDGTIKRAYQLQNIIKSSIKTMIEDNQQQLDVIGSESTSLPAPSAIADNQRLSAKGSGSASLAQSSQPLLMQYTVSQLFQLVKQNDTNFNPKPVGKVVNEDGTPKVVYHGTAEEFFAFDKNLRGINTGAQSSKRAFFFTSSRRVAEGYANDARPQNIQALYNKAERLEKQAASNGRYDLAEQAWMDYEKAELGYDGRNYIIGVYIDLKNPFIYDFKGSEYRETTYIDLVKKAIANGNDGVIFENTFDASNVTYDEMCDIYAVFEPDQIKSATDNIGTFNRDDVDIRYSMQGGNHDGGQGSLLSDGSSERENGTDTQKQAQTVAGGARSYQEGRKTASERRKYCEALKAAGHTEKKIKYGVEALFISPDGYNAEMNAIVEENRLKGVNTEFITGTATIGFTGGKKARGVFDSASNTIVIQYDHYLYSPQQLNRHEGIHKDYQTRRIQKAKNIILNNISAAEKQTILKKISEDYNGIINGMEEQIFEEFICNTMAGMNEYTARFEQLVNDYWDGKETVDYYSPKDYTESIDAGGRIAEGGSNNESSNAEAVGRKRTSKNNDSIWERSDDSKGIYRRVGNRTHVLRRSQETGHRLINWSKRFANLNVFKSGEKERSYGILRKISRLSIAQTDAINRPITSEVQNFFKNTVIKNTKGELVPVYHATDKNFDIFEQGDFGFHLGSTEQALSFNKKYIKEVYANITTPVFISEDTMHWYGLVVASKLQAQGIISNAEYERLSRLDGFISNDYNSPANKAIREILKQKGYDGIVYNNGFEGDGISFIAFDPNQIKYMELSRIVQSKKHPKFLIDYCAVCRLQSL